MSGHSAGTALHPADEPGDEFEPTWKPWFDDRRFTRAQQWLFALPHGGDPAAE